MIDKAIRMALKAHKDQVRKGTSIPYITHPLAVGIILACAGCEDPVIAAGILHDTVEDTPVTLDEIRAEFGEEVAGLVAGASEPDKSLPWEKRKRHTLEFLKTAPLKVRLVACADKLHNIRTIVSDYEKEGERVWDRFKRGREAQEQYYRGIVDVLCKGSDMHGYESLFAELERAVEDFFGKT